MMHKSKKWKEVESETSFTRRWTGDRQADLRIEAPAGHRSTARYPLPGRRSTGTLLVLQSVSISYSGTIAGCRRLDR